VTWAGAGRPVALVLTAVALAGCGSSPLSTKGLQTRASRICRATDARVERIPTPITPGQGATFLRRSLAALTPELLALRRLHPGGDAGPVYARALSARAAELAAIRASIHRIDHGDDPVLTVQRLQREIAPLEQRENAAWSELAIPACGAR
jgi:hypothetical protein